MVAAAANCKDILIDFIGGIYLAGIDPDSSANILIENCNISCGDDHIAIKSGMDRYGPIALGWHLSHNEANTLACFSLRFVSVVALDAWSVSRPETSLCAVRNFGGRPVPEFNA